MYINRITRRYSCESAHYLPKVPEGHKCKRMHGHNYVFDIEIEGELNEQGFVMDFWDVDKIVQPILDRIDHRVLNEVEGLENPTAEIIAGWFVDQIQLELPGNYTVYAVHVFETPDAKASVLRPLGGYYSGRSSF